MTKKNKGGSNTTTEVGRDVLAVFKDLLSPEDLEKFKDNLRKRIAYFQSQQEKGPKEIRREKARKAAEEYALTGDIVSVSKKHRISIKRILEETE